MYRVRWDTFKISQIFWKIWSERKKTAMGVFQLWSYFLRYLFSVHMACMYYPREAKERYALRVVSAFSTVSFFMHRDDPPSFLIFRCPSRRLAT